MSPIAPRNSAMAISRSSGVGTLATPVCPFARSFAFDQVPFVTAEKRNTVASNAWPIHNMTFIGLSSHGLEGRQRRQVGRHPRRNLSRPERQNVYGSSD